MTRRAFQAPDPMLLALPYPLCMGASRFDFNAPAWLNRRTRHASTRARLVQASAFGCIKPRLADGVSSPGLETLQREGFHHLPPNTSGA